MKLMTLRFLLMSLLLSVPIFEGLGQSNSVLTIEVEGIEKAEGFMMLAVYDKPENFLSKDLKDMFKASKTEVSQTGTMQILLEIPFSEYGISVYHDLDADGELNTNFIGIPKEPIGFSNKAKATFGPPKYEDAKFSFKEKGQVMTIHLD